MSDEQERTSALDQTDGLPSAPEAPTTDTPSAEPDSQVRVAVVGPLWVDAFQASDTLTVDRLGVLVDEADVAALIELASESGVSLKAG